MTEVLPEPGGEGPRRVPLGRKCDRPGCNQEATATMVFDYRRAEAWLCELWPEEGPGSYDFCARHAERFSPPAGWTFVDKRAPTVAFLKGERDDAVPRGDPYRSESHLATA